MLTSMLLEQLLTEKREAILSIAAKHGAFNVKIFGSVARGEETENSDIDFLVDYDLSEISPWFPVRLIRDLEAILGRKVDVVTQNGLQERIKEKVLKDCVKL
ncbi:Tsl2232 protein [Crocosphaera watsonii WH 0005]|uniref:DNA polymerase, beta-like region n=6 Tax=Crocosphaera watsonii TaxID=263511 RepID=Q4C572_CROWT|nr:DNA polymerase, beta-like region [Crocosphaera watsonii WH 8501]CCQ55837.1 Tsl2232 protein [Crocosphaera watsonii WH 0005]